MNPSLLHLIYCPFCGGDLDWQPAKSRTADPSEFGILSCGCGRYPVVAGIPIIKKRSIGVIDRRPCEPWQVINLIEAGRFREALLAVVLPPRPETASPEWQKEAEDLFTQTESTTACDLLDFYFGHVGGWSEFTSTHFFTHRFGQPKHLVALSLASIIDQPNRPVLDLACGAGHITRVLVKRAEGKGVVGLDRSFFVLFVAKNRLASKANYVCGDADAALPFRDGSFSLAFCVDAFHLLVNRVTCISELKRLTGDDGTVVLTGLANNLVNKHPTTLSIEGYEALVADMPHRLVTNIEILCRYLQKQGPSLAEPANLADLATAPWFSIVASHSPELLKDYGSFDEWPHVDDCLTLNPLYKEAQRDQKGNLRLKRVFPSSHYEQENAEYRFQQFQPETVSIHETILNELDDGKRTTTIDKLIEQCVVIGMPKDYMRTTLSSDGVVSSPEPAFDEAYVEQIERIKISDLIARRISPGDRFILVDQGHWGVVQIAGRPAIPFIERNGQYWGPPEDGHKAVQELERLRQTGASHIVFGEPALWWFHYYFELRDYIRNRFRCVLDNDRLLIFDLRSSLDESNRRQP